MPTSAVQQPGEPVLNVTLRRQQCLRRMPCSITCATCVKHCSGQRLAQGSNAGLAVVVSVCNRIRPQPWHAICQFI